MKQLKTLLIAAALFIGANQTISAQAKVAHIDVQELMTNMPEMKTAQAQVKKISETYDNEYKTMVTEYQNKMKKYESEASTVTEAVNETRAKEMQDMGQRIQQYRDTAQKELQQKEMDLVKPIMDKAKAAIQKVAKVKGFQYVLDATPGSGVIVAEGPSLLTDVKKELGF
ncbi:MULTISPECIES: OmpH family outer membrane protein [Flavobacterium]|uniref:OmpH family outer membrane protein n=1 Tax=Flavobacterium TaxID=237 RepID=UPI001FCB0500|nr:MULTISPECIES: OmpH family outer membrane protein [Flavobacterium]UOK42801.1 OmpH family outer membrane protein [Flavobacterium enshiense]